MTAIETNPLAIFRRKSRSFSLAARLFSPADQLAAARLYRFCRHLDDLADDTVDGDAAALENARAVLRGSVAAVPGSIEADFLDLAAERGLPLDAGIELIDALIADCGPRGLETPGDLVRFAYGVAGTVGLLLHRLIGARDPAAMPFSIDLGIALQLTNIARDVAEDARRGRFYLPAAWVSPSDIGSALDGDDPEATAATLDALRRVLHLADGYYASARAGHWFIPPRNRPVIFLAAGLYEAIGLRVWRDRPASLHQRVSLGGGEKLRVAVRMIPLYRHYRHECWRQPDPPRHDAALHRDLASVRGRPDPQPAGETPRP
jgi:phytoene synthase